MIRYEPKRRFRVSEAVLADETRRIVNECFKGIPPISTDFFAKAHFSKTTFYNRYGSYQRALEAAGLSYVPKRSKRVIYVTPFAHRIRELRALTDDDLFDELWRVWRLRSRRPTRVEFDAVSKFGSPVYITRFGSWTKAVLEFCKDRKIHIQGTPGTSVSREMLLNELRSILPARSGDRLTFADYRKAGGAYSLGTFRNYFGSWTSVVKSLGMKTGKDVRYSIEELFGDLQRVWEHLGEQPTYDQMKILGRVSPKPYVSMFGSWRGAIRAFCDDRNKSATSAETECPSESDGHSPSQPPSHAGTETHEVKPHCIVRSTPRLPADRLRFKVLNRDNFSCRKCGRSPAIERGVILEVDHIVPYSLGGETVLHNLQTLCRKCNSGKSNYQDG